MQDKQQTITGIVVSLSALIVAAFGLEPESAEQLTSGAVGVVSGAFAIYKVYVKNKG